MNNNVTSFQLGSTIPALLAEEWLVQPSAMLPNIFELFLVEQGNQTFLRTLDEALRTLRDKIHTYRINEGNNEIERGHKRNAFGWLATELKSWCIRLAHRLDSLLTKHRTEILFLIYYLVERQSILRNSSTLAEHMYGLRRSSIANNTNGQLRNDLQQRERLALLLTLIPYVRLRIRDIFPTQRLLWQTTNILVTAHRCADSAFLLGYMTERTHYSNTLNYLLRHVVRRIAQTELRTTATPTTTTTKSFPIERYKHHASKLLCGVVILSYAVQFFSWYRHSFPSPIPEPPPYDEAIPSQCPMCGQLEIADPTVLVTTGLVYCHPCITRYLRIHRMCPVTKLPDPRWQRLHEPL